MESETPGGGLRGVARGRRHFDDETVKRRMLDAGIDIVRESGGLTVSLAHMNLEDVMYRARVSRSAVYRVWKNGKDEFYTDLLCALTVEADRGERNVSAFDQLTIDMAQAIIARSLDRLKTPEGRRLVLEEVVRSAAQQNYEASVSSESWRNYVLVTASLMSLEDGEAKTKIQTSLRGVDDEFLRIMSSFYAEMAAVLGLRLRPPLSKAGDGFVTLAICGAALVEGLALRTYVMPDAVDREFGIDNEAGERETWPMPALAFMRILDGLTEPDPDYDWERVMKVAANDSSVPGVSANTKDAG